MAKQSIQQIKQRFEIIGTSPELDRAIDIALQVAPTDLSVLITGESGVGKENFPQIVHQFSKRKHGPYFAINCGSIPEGTIDSELFGHEKGSFPVLQEPEKVILKLLMVEHCFWMKWENCLCQLRRVCLEYWRVENL